MFLKSLLVILLASTTITIVAQNNDKVAFKQNHKKVSIKKDNIITLKKQPFSVVIPHKKYNSDNNLYYATQIAVLENKLDLNILEPGSLIENIPFFQGGSGIAADENNTYNTLFIGTDAHHYLYYENTENNRLTLIKELRNEFVGEWQITNFYNSMDDKTEKMRNLKQKVLYFVIFRNHNLDEIMDENELEIYTLRFF